MKDQQLTLVLCSQSFHLVLWINFLNNRLQFCILFCFSLCSVVFSEAPWPEEPLVKNRLLANSDILFPYLLSICTVPSQTN